MTVQIIEKDGEPEWAVVPYGTYQRLIEDAEMLQDIRAYDEAKKLVNAGEELVPSDVTYGILDGGNPIKVWREHRGMTRQQLAETADIPEERLAEFEGARQRADDKTLASIAEALGLSREDIKTVD
jgi:DNA-binding XRE family transcriptional regulator